MDKINAAAPVGSVGDDLQFLKKLTAYRESNADEPFQAAIDHIDALIAESRYEGRRDAHETNISLLGDICKLTERAEKAEALLAARAAPGVASAPVSAPVAPTADRDAALEGAALACENEMLVDNMAHDADLGYNMAVRDVARAIRALKGSVAPLAVPLPADQSGWKLVPIEPTVEMLSAAIKCGKHSTKYEYYAAMLAAAPAAPLPLPADQRESYWMVESVHGLGWWDGRFLSRGIDPRFFTHNPNEAVLFARKDDANRVCKQSSALKFTAHVWVAAPAAPLPLPAGPSEQWQIWIPTAERMPDPYREVHAKNVDGSVRIARRSKKYGGCWQLACFGRETSLWPNKDVTHWCVLSNFDAPVIPQAAPGEVQTLTKQQEPKYGGMLFNRASGEAIPTDEPVFIFRARDKWAVMAIAGYMRMLPHDAHRKAVLDRVNEFQMFTQDHPERMKEPDTASAQTGEGEQP